MGALRDESGMEEGAAGVWGALTLPALSAARTGGSGDLDQVGSVGLYPAVASLRLGIRKLEAACAGVRGLGANLFGAGRRLGHLDQRDLTRAPAIPGAGCVVHPTMVTMVDPHTDLAKRCPLGGAALGAVQGMGWLFPYSPMLF